jgi:hypothetical protein
MDPNLFNVDGDRLMQVLFMIIVLSFVVERALSLLFESRFYLSRAKGTSLREVIAFAVSSGICVTWNFDALSILLVQEKTTLYGAIITGAVIAGGSKGAVKLFHDVLGMKSSAKKAYEAAEKVKFPPVGMPASRTETVDQ